MSNETQLSAVTNPAAKATTAWLAVGFTSWADVASFLAAVYTMLLLIEFAWKRWLRPFGECRGWLKRLKRRKSDREQDES